MKLTLLRRNSEKFWEEIKWGMRSMRNGVKHRKVLLEMFLRSRQQKRDLFGHQPYLIEAQPLLARQDRFVEIWVQFVLFLNGKITQH